MLKTLRGMRKPHIRWRKLFLTFAGFGLAAGIIAISGSDRLAGILKPDIPLTLLACGIIALQLFFFSERWRTLTIGVLEAHTATSFEHFLYVLSSRVTSQFLPETASVIVVRSTLLNRLHAVPLKIGITSVLLDKSLDLLMVILLIGPTLLFLSGLVSTTLAFFVSLGLLGIVAAVVTLRPTAGLTGIQALIAALTLVIQKVPFLQRVSVLAKLESLEVTEWQFLHHSSVLRAFWLTVCGQILMVIRTWLIARAVDVNISGITAFWAVALAQSSIIIAITPGSLGIMETSWYLVLDFNHVPSEQIAVFVVAHRLFSIIAVTLAWLITYGLAMNRPTLTPHAQYQQNTPIS
jgi:uncharacterized protein (TIRG00374 family)